MRARTVEQRLRLFLLAVSALIFAGTAVELWFTEHTGSTLQLVPFVLCGVGFLAVTAALYAPRRPTLLVLRGLMALVATGSLYGIYEHIEHNLTFELEIRPGSTVGDVFWEALSGASPLLAPGILALSAALAVAATYRHPRLAAPFGIPASAE